MFNFITSKFSSSSKDDAGDESGVAEKGLGVTSNQSEYSESILVPPSETNAEVNESADQLTLSQLQRENEDLQERTPNMEKEIKKLELDRVQLYQVLDQLYSLHDKSPPSEASPNDTEGVTNNDTSIDEVLSQETVRDLLRNAITKEELENAIARAQSLGMTFEAALGEKKLAKIT